MRSIFIILLLFGYCVSEAQVNFNRNYDNSNRSEFFSSIIFDSGHYYSCGFSAYGNYSKIYAVKLDLQGDTIITKSIGFDSTFYYLGLRSIFKGNKNYILLGTSIKDSSYPYIASMNSSLDTLWMKTWYNYKGGLNSGVYKKPYYYFSGFAEVGSGSNLYDLMIIKTDTLGNIIWQNVYTGFDDEAAYSIDTTISGGLIVSGYEDSPTNSWNIYVVKTDSLGNILSGWPKVFSTADSEAASAKTLSDGNFLLYGGWASGSGNEYAHMRKLDQNGNTLWQKNYQGPSASISLCYFTDAVEFPNGDLAFTGSFFDPQTNNPSGWIVKTDATGNELWRRTLRLRTNDHYLYGIISTPDGGFALSGALWPDGPGTTQDGWIVKLDSMGCVISGCSVGIEEEDFISDVVVYPNPSNGTFYIESDNWNDATYELFDLNGRLIHSANLNSNLIEITVPFETGIFVLKIQNSNGIFTKKIIVH